MRTTAPRTAFWSIVTSTIVLLVAIALPTASVLAADCVVPSTGVATPITLRAAPAASSSARGTLGTGQSLPLIASVPGWYETCLANGQMAFAAKRSADLAACPASIGGPAPAPAPISPPSAAGVTYELHAIDVGTGLSLLVRGPDFAVLYDAGSNDDSFALADRHG